MMRAVVVAGLLCAHAAFVSAQSVSFWIDGNAAHTRPPSLAAADASNYGLLGLRLRADGTASTIELSATTGRGAAEGSGGWLSGRAALDASRVNGVVDAGMRADVTGLTYIDDVHLNATDRYRQLVMAGSARPYAGLSIGGFRLGLDAQLTRGYWRADVSTVLLEQGPGLPLAGREQARRQTASDDGDIQIVGGSASLLRVLGPATVEVRASRYEAHNQAASGRYSGIDGLLALSIGALDVNAGARIWDTPLQRGEIGAHAGLGIALGNSAYVQATASRSVSDPLYGAIGDVSLTAGVSLSLGQRSLGPPLPATLGAPSGSGRIVRFTFKGADARSVAVAGDFSGWEQRTMQRTGDGVWTLETVLAPGVYHYSFVVNGETWTVPENAPGLVDDGFGQKNATLVVTAAG